MVLARDSDRAKPISLYIHTYHDHMANWGGYLPGVEEEELRLIRRFLLCVHFLANSGAAV